MSSPTKNFDEKADNSHTFIGDNGRLIDDEDNNSQKADEHLTTNHSITNKYREPVESVKVKITKIVNDVKSERPKLEELGVEDDIKNVQTNKVKQQQKQLMTLNITENDDKGGKLLFFSGCVFFLVTFLTNLSEKLRYRKSKTKHVKKLMIM